jgi:hypothetical protein
VSPQHDLYNAVTQETKARQGQGHVQTLVEAQETGKDKGQGEGRGFGGVVSSKSSGKLVRKYHGHQGCKTK